MMELMLAIVSLVLVVAMLALLVWFVRSKILSLL